MAARNCCFEQLTFTTSCASRHNLWALRRISRVAGVDNKWLRIVGGGGNRPREGVSTWKEEFEQSKIYGDAWNRFLSPLFLLRGFHPFSKYARPCVKSYQRKGDEHIVFFITQRRNDLFNLKLDRKNDYSIERSDLALKFDSLRAEWHAIKYLKYVREIHFSALEIITKKQWTK